MRSLLAYLACITALVAAGAGYAKLSEADIPLSSQQAQSAQPEGHGKGRTANWIRLRVRVKGLYPGQRRWAIATVRNRTSNRLTLRSVRPRVRDEDTDCAGYVTIERRKFTRLLPRHSRRYFKLRVAMAPDAVDACQNVKLRVTLRARATLR
jgi:hypothetical protein